MHTPEPLPGPTAPHPAAPRAFATRRKTRTNGSRPARDPVGGREPTARVPTPERTPGKQCAPRNPYQARPHRTSTRPARSRPRRRARANGSRPYPGANARQTVRTPELLPGPTAPHPNDPVGGREPTARVPTPERTQANSAHPGTRPDRTAPQRAPRVRDPVGGREPTARVPTPGRAPSARARPRRRRSTTGAGFGWRVSLESPRT